MKIGAEKEISFFFRELVNTLVSVIEEKDVYMQGHAERVASFCVSFCKTLNLPEEHKELDKIYFAALLHDIGMVYVPLAISQKSEKLTEDEMAVIRQHPVTGEKILSNLTILKDILPIIYHHHEKFDGSGYPDGLKGEDIPLGARIINLADCYDALTSPRAHREAMEMEDALMEIHNKGGTQFDENLANAFIEFIESIGGVAEVVREREEEKKKAEKAEKEEEKKAVHDVLLDIVRKFKRGKIEPPVLPQVVQELRNVTGNPNSTADDMAEAIEKDAVISVKLISVANSPHYRGHQQINTVRQAVPRLGVKLTDNLVSAIANKSLYKTPKPQFRILMEKLWKHSLASAYSAKAIAKNLRLGDIEIFFMMGLLHDIGKVILVKSLSEIPPEKVSLKMAEVLSTVQQFHCAFGVSVLQKWGFDQNFLKVAKLHEGPDFAPEIEKEILVVNLANNMTRNMGYRHGGEKVELMELQSTELLGIDADRLVNIEKEVKKAMRESAQFF